MADRLDCHANLVLSVESRLERLMRQLRLPACECEDSIQEAWLALLETHPEWALDEPRTLAFLIVVARNKASDFHRQKNRHRVRQLDDLTPVPAFDRAQTSPDADEYGWHQEMISKLLDALNRLSEINREILLQRAVQGLPYRAIGLALGLKPEQVKEHYHRTVHQLNRMLRSNKQGCNDGRGGREPPAKPVRPRLFRKSRSSARQQALGRLESLIRVIPVAASPRHGFFTSFHCLIWQRLASEEPSGLKKHKSIRPSESPDTQTLIGSGVEA